LKYRVSLAILLDRYEDAKEIYNFLARRRHLFKTIRKGTPAEERSLIMLEENHHDEDPPRPCKVLESLKSE